METVKKYSDGGRMVRLDGVEFSFGRDGLVGWMSDWGAASQFEARGIFSSKFYRHLYGHTDFYLAERERGR